MIDDVDASLRILLSSGGPGLAGIEVSFDAPTTEWASRRSAPTVNVFLYDLREDLHRRSAGRTEERDSAGRVVARRRMRRFFRLSYLLTAWTSRPEDEHHLLSALLRCCIQHQRLPQTALVGTLAMTREPTTLTVGRPPSDDRSISEVWSALGGELKPSLDLAVSAPVDVDELDPIGPPVLEEPRFRFVRPVGAGRTLPVPAEPVGRRGIAPPGPDDPDEAREARNSGAPEPAPHRTGEIEIAEVIQAKLTPRSDSTTRPSRAGTPAP
jgi:hypothetical protein